MESKQHEWMTNDQEVNQHDIDNLDLGVGRTYQCVFCKRGFTTAQALGGHMNIHRKDRAKTTTTTRPTFNNKKDENYTAGSRFYQPITSYSPCYSTADQRAQIHYRNFLPTSSAHDDYRINLSNMQFGTAKFVEDMEAKMRGGVHDDGLDLELRLGHEP